MAKLFGYMVTWTTYGSWLQGDKRGYVKDGRILDADERMFKRCRELQKNPAVRLRQKEKQIVHAAILNEAKRIGHTIEALVICSNHVHLAARPCDKSIERIVSMYKSAATRALRRCGRTGRLWTKGFNKTFSFTPDELAAKVSYIQNHK